MTVDYIKNTHVSAAMRSPKSNTRVGIHSITIPCT